MMKNYPLEKKEFLEAYRKATGIDISSSSGVGCCTPQYPLYDRLSDLYDGQLPYEYFLRHLTRGNTSDAGGIAFALYYSTKKTQKLRNCEYFLIYFIFVILYSVYVQTDQDAAKSFYLTRDIIEHVSNDESQYVTGERNFFPWGFKDIANDGDYWGWITSNALNYIWSEEGGIPGFEVVQGRTNRIIGGVRLHQYRQEERECKDDSDAENLNDDGICPTRIDTGDVRQATNWKAINSFENEGGATAYASPTCLSPLFGYERNDNSDRTFRVCVSNRHNSEVAGEIFKILAEERLMGIAIAKTLKSTDQCVTDLRNGDVDAVIGAWDLDLSDGTLGTDFETLKDHPFPTARMHTWMSTGFEQEWCITCASRGWLGLGNAFFDKTIAAATYVSAPAHLGWTTNMDTLLQGYKLGGDSSTYNSHVTPVVYKKTPSAADPTYSDYMSQWLAGSYGDGLASFFYGDDVLGATLNGIKMEQDAYLNANFSSSIKTYVRADVKERFVDIYQLLKSMKWETASLFSSDIPTAKATASACVWVTANEPSWVHWVRTPIRRDIEKRMNQFNTKCFGPWIDDTLSESRTSFLDVRNRLTRDEFSQANFPDGNYAKKVYFLDGSALSTTDFVYAPTREVFFENRAKAERGDIDAERAWKSTQAWVWRSCSEMNSVDNIVPYRGRVQPRESITLYRCNGYGIFLPISKTKVQIKEELDILRLNNWIDIATRGILLEFFVHSQNSRQIARFQYMVEVSAEGAYIPSLKIVAFFLFQVETIQFAGLWYTGIVLLTLAYLYILFQFVIKFGRDNNSELQAMTREAGSNHGSNWPCTIYLDDYVESEELVENKDSKSRHPFLRKAGSAVAFFSRYIGNFFSKIGMLTMFNYIQISFLIMFFLTWVIRVLIFTTGLTASSLFCTDRYPEHLGFVCVFVFFYINVWIFTLIKKTKNRLQTCIQ